MDNRRSHPRVRSFLQGRIYFNKRNSSLDCLVRDLSEDGARLKVSSSVALPEVVELHLPNKNETHQATVQWRTGDEIGVAFDVARESPSIASDAPATDLATRVRHLESEVALLHRRFNELRNELGKRQTADI
jgi:hypothetical protein